jgi:ribonuclease HII
MSRAPSLRVERELLRSGVRWLAAVDEVGRGSLAGPVSVGIVLIDAGVRTAPTGLRDSKLLTAQARRTLVPRLRRWAPAWAVGHAGPDEIDRVGILRALRTAGERALAQLPHRPDHVLLDGSYDWLSRPPPALFELDGTVSAYDLDAVVTTRVKADLTCASVAAASVLAKTTRDDMMVELACVHPVYGWEVNKGYASPEHRAALDRHGTCELHRRSWNLFGPQDGPDQPGPDDKWDGEDPLDEIDLGSAVDLTRCQDEAVGTGQGSAMVGGGSRHERRGS